MMYVSAMEKVLDMMERTLKDDMRYEAKEKWEFLSLEFL
jgi:hypothetical protein